MRARDFFYLFSFGVVVAAIGFAVASPLTRDSIVVKSEVHLMNLGVVIDGKISDEVVAQLLFEVDGNNQCTGDVVLALSYGRSARSTVSARKLLLAVGDEDANAISFERTYSFLPVGLKLDLPNTVRLVLSKRVLHDSKGLGSDLTAGTLQTPTLKLELREVTRK